MSDEYGLAPSHRGPALQLHYIGRREFPVAEVCDLKSDSPFREAVDAKLADPNIMVLYFAGENLFATQAIYSCLGARHMGRYQVTNLEDYRYLDISPSPADIVDIEWVLGQLFASQLYADRIAEVHSADADDLPFE